MSHCFTGQFCETAVDPCTANPCPTGAQCIANDTDRLCICAGDFKGEFCNESKSLPYMLFITIITLIFFILEILYLSVDGGHLKFFHIHRLLISPLNNTMHSWAGKMCFDYCPVINFEVVNKMQLSKCFMLKSLYE